MQGRPRNRQARFTLRDPFGDVVVDPARSLTELLPDVCLESVRLIRHRRDRRIVNFPGCASSVDITCHATVNGYEGDLADVATTIFRTKIYLPTQNRRFFLVSRLRMENKAGKSNVSTKVNDNCFHRFTTWTSTKIWETG